MRDDLISDASSITADTRGIEFDATVEFGLPAPPGGVTNRAKIGPFGG
jgi:hypothetical protein